MSWKPIDDAGGYVPKKNDEILVSTDPGYVPSHITLRYCDECVGWHPLNPPAGWSPCALLFNWAEAKFWRPKV